eukprot:TRINITY_DN33562_c0_g1_i1.p1 TRINITY_DN33562_c0_g1~~TRINITY_DN33562_c0_g1_i1.p1  ORF type:complete len:1407 (+),score=296.85 TRINITY_DN33562_c0_g1_i1:88-4308(+)
MLRDDFWASWLLCCLLLGLLEAAGGQFVVPSTQYRAENQWMNREIKSFEINVGGVLPLTGKYEEFGRHARQGFQICRETTNNGMHFFTSSGYPIYVKVQFMDDRSDFVRTRILYNRFMKRDVANGDKPIPHVFLGPYSTEATLDIAALLDPLGVVMLAHAAAEPKIYRGFTNVFNVETLVTEYFYPGLNQLRSQGATTVFIACSTQSEYYRAMCEGAQSAAKDLEFKSLGVMEIGPNSITAIIRQARIEQPDVMVVCSDLTDAISVAVTSAALGFSPKALFMNEAEGAAFHQAAGVHNANYVMSPRTWANDTVDPCLPDENRPQPPLCRLFNSSQQFVQLYQEKWGEPPTSTAAVAAAACIAILAAAEGADAPEPPERLRTVLGGVEVPTFYGTLKFKEQMRMVNRELGDYTVLASQYWPMNVDAEGNHIHHDHYHSESVVYTQLREVNLGRHSRQGTEVKVRYPMPSQEVKHVQVYPCSAGMVINYSSPKTLDCVRCPVGKFRDPHSVACQKCLEGAYAASAGQSECTRCVDGLNCSKVAATGQEEAIAGWYLLKKPGQPSMIQQCGPGGFCVGANACGEANRGVLCEQCQPGFTKRGVHRARVLQPAELQTHKCVHCPNRAVLGVKILAICAVYVGLIALLGFSARRSAETLSSMHTGVLRIVVSYLQLFSVAVISTQLHLKSAGLHIFVSVFLDPLEGFFSLECSPNLGGLAPYQAYGLLGMCLLPVVLLLCFVASAIATCLRATICKRLQMVRKSLAKRAGAMRMSTEDFAEEACEMRFEPTSSLDSLDTMVVTALKMQSRVLPEGWVKLHSMEWDVGEESRDSIEADEGFWSRVTAMTIRISSIATFLVFPQIFACFQRVIRCRIIDRPRLTYDLDVICYGDEHRPWFALGVFGLVFYGLLLPIWISHHLHALGWRMMEVKTRRKYSFCSNGYGRYCFGTYGINLTRIAIFATVVHEPNPWLSLASVSLCSIGFASYNLVYTPHDSRDYGSLGYMETLTLMAAFVPCAANFLDRLRMASLDGSFDSTLLTSGVMQNVIVVVVVGMQLVLLALAFGALFRDIYLKHYVFLESHAPEFLNGFQRLLLRVFLTHRRQLVHFDSESHELAGIDQLSLPEKKLLAKAFTDTLEAYIRVDSVRDASQGDEGMFYPGYLGAAIRSAMMRVSESSDKRLQAYLMTDNTATWNNMASKMSQEDSDEKPAVQMRKKGNQSANLFATVEDLLLALMLEWPLIEDLKEHCFVIDKLTDRERALRRKGHEPINWTADDTVNDLFAELRGRHGHLKKRNRRDRKKQEGDWAVWDTSESLSMGWQMSRFETQPSGSSPQSLLGFEETNGPEGSRKQKEVMAQRNNELAQELMDLKAELSSATNELRRLSRRYSDAPSELERNRSTPERERTCSSST